MRRASFATPPARRSPGSRTRPGTSSRSSRHPLAADDLLEVARLRLRNHRVTGAKLSSAAEVVSWLGCVQAQEYQLSKWSLGMRVGPSMHDADVDAALARGAILRTHILRPTWHFVAPDDIRTFMRLTGPRVLAGSAGRVRRLGRDGGQLNAAKDAIANALGRGKHLTRLELQAELERAGLHPDGQRIAYIVMDAEMELLIASGAPRGGKQTYALLDEWAPPTARDKEPFDRDRALAELMLRYFTSHGPATIADFTWWSGLTAADTRRGLATNGSALESIDRRRHALVGWRCGWIGRPSASSRPPPDAGL